MKRKQANEITKNIIESISTELNEKYIRQVNVLKLNIDRTKNLLFKSFSPEQLELFNDYEQAQSDYVNYIMKNKT